MSDSVRPHRRQPPRLRCPWDSPGKNTGVGCHFLVQCVRETSESEVAQSCPTLSDPMDCSLPGSVHGIFQARVLEWGAIAFSGKNNSIVLKTFPVLCASVFVLSVGHSQSCFCNFLGNCPKINLPHGVYFFSFRTWPCLR